MQSSVAFPERKLTDQIKVGDLVVRNRVMMAALTRQRCDPDLNVPTEMVAEYYEQRAGAGIILSEATAISVQGEGFYGAASLHNQEQLEGWKNVVNRVHAKGGLIVAQLFHAGRSTHEKVNKGVGAVSSSAIARREGVRPFDVQYPVPTQLTLEGIKNVHEDFRKSVLLAKQAGFDGVQVHGAHGYLVDTFLRTSANTRTDQYGGSVENRCRFALEWIDIATSIFGAGRVGIKISPVTRAGDMYDQNPTQTFSYLLKELSARNIAFVEIRDSKDTYIPVNYYNVLPWDQISQVCKTLRPFFNGTLVANNGFDTKTGLQIIQEGSADMVSFGRLYISNPDLAERIANGWELNQTSDYKTFYGHELKERGYTDYPFYEVK